MIIENTNRPEKKFQCHETCQNISSIDTRPKSNAMSCKGVGEGVKNVKLQFFFFCIINEMYIRT